MFLTFLDRYRDAGLLLLRIGIGAVYIFAHGLSKITGGPAFWEQLGGAAGAVGLTFLPTFWGFMAAFAEFFGGILLVLGLFFRPAAILMCLTMIVATIGHATGVIPGGPFHPLKMAILFFSLILIGPGRYSFDEQYGRRRRTGF